MEEIDEGEVRDSLIEFSKAVSDEFSMAEETFMLNGPSTLTVKKKDGSYSKVPHIGGEDFKPDHVYVGKRGDLIFVFTPVMAAGYTQIEMKELEAMRQLSGLKEYLTDIHYYDTLGAIHIKRQKIKEAKTVKEKAGQYSGEFGSW